MQQQQVAGSKNVPYQGVSENEGSGATKTTVYLCNIVVQPQFQGPNEKQFEELRMEDYQVATPLDQRPVERQYEISTFYTCPEVCKRWN